MGTLSTVIPPVVAASTTLPPVVAAATTHVSGSNPQHHNPGPLALSSDTANLLRSAWPDGSQGTWPLGPFFSIKPVVAGAPKVGIVVPPAVAAVKCKHDEFDVNSGSDESHHSASPNKSLLPNQSHHLTLTTTAVAAAAAAAYVSSNTGDGDEAKPVTVKQKMPRINKEERACVCE
jgi:hypothetical protein